MYYGSVNVNVEILHGKNQVYYEKALVLDVKNVEIKTILQIMVKLIFRL